MFVTYRHIKYFIFCSATVVYRVTLMSLMCLKKLLIGPCIKLFYWC